MKSSRLLISRIRLWKNISGSPSSRLDNWKRHINQEVGGGWRLTSHVGWRLGGGTLRSLGGAWGDLRRRRYRVGRPHSLIRTLIGINRIDDVINLRRRQLG
ncbi:uncharacterized protein LOC120351847 [Nilaparvata lugens]|uniref:uncharacterized protein LOC120351847 n=1 Tax=Nilaparvata lugens TaxID=108931 RepID=UPI00193E9D42|nr:uncharacterized protein LOC120351847 [Nilaparvata lugens]XP_039286435.1 uncharacterized protein LOC120351847 [Nilaparvata lugens]XP_039286436.1 uncharacterized protein LOC120351847 [Nilaparvata lugens]